MNAINQPKCYQHKHEPATHIFKCHVPDPEWVKGDERRLAESIETCHRVNLFICSSCVCGEGNRVFNWPDRFGRVKIVPQSEMSDDPKWVFMYVREGLAYYVEAGTTLYGYYPEHTDKIVKAGRILK